MRRRRAEEPLPSNDRWMLSWSDFVTLLLAVFAAMYAVASVDQAKAKAVTRSVETAFRKPVLPQMLEKADGQLAQLAGEAMEKELTSALSDLGFGDRLRVQRDGPALGIDIDAELLFAEGDARLSSEATRILAGMGQFLRHRPCDIRVEGHTDAKPIGNTRFASNWELSAARAATVVRALARQGIDERRMQAVGLASNQPLTSNDSEQGRARNRRVHLLLLNISRNGV